MAAVPDVSSDGAATGAGLGHGHAVVGGDESSEFLRHSKTIADAWRAKGVETRYEAIPGLNHFTICDPMADPNSAMTKRLVELAKRI